MSKIWVRVADKKKAKIYATAEVPSRLNLIEEFISPMASVIASEKPADAHTSTCEFAKYLGDILGRAKSAGKFSWLVLVADPQFIDRLKQSLDQATKYCIISALEKNLTHAPMLEIERSVLGIIEQACSHPAGNTHY